MKMTKPAGRGKIYRKFLRLITHFDINPDKEFWSDNDKSFFIGCLERFIITTYPKEFSIPKPENNIIQEIEDITGYFENTFHSNSRIIRFNDRAATISRNLGQRGAPLTVRSITEEDICMIKLSCL